MTDDDPAHLTRRLQSGDWDAAEPLARRAGNAALRTAAAALGDREAARDIAQDVAVDVLRGIASLRDPGRFDAWAHRIAVRHTMTALRSRRQRILNESPLADLAPGQEPSAIDTTDSGEAAAIRDALAALPPKQHLAMVLRYVHDLSEAQIADALGCPEGTASAYLARARRSLRRSPRLRDLVTAAFFGGVR